MNRSPDQLEKLRAGRLVYPYDYGGARASFAVTQRVELIPIRDKDTNAITHVMFLDQDRQISLKAVIAHLVTFCLVCPSVWKTTRTRLYPMGEAVEKWLIAPRTKIIA